MCSSDLSSGFFESSSGANCASKCRRKISFASSADIEGSEVLDTLDALRLPRTAIVKVEQTSLTVEMGCRDVVLRGVLLVCS